MVIGNADSKGRVSMRPKDETCPSQTPHSQNARTYSRVFPPMRWLQFIWLEAHCGETRRHT